MSYDQTKEIHTNSSYFREKALVLKDNANTILHEINENLIKENIKGKGKENQIKENIKENWKEKIKGKGKENKKENGKENQGQEIKDTNKDGIKECQTPSAV